MKKKYILRIGVRNNMESHHIGEVELNTINFAEFDRIRTFQVYHPDSYLIFSLDELPEGDEED